MLPHLRTLMLQILLASIVATEAQTCPQWVTSLITDTLVQRLDFPGVQLALSLPRCALDCRIGIPSNATDYANEPPLLVDTPWRIASITKTFTAVAVLRLAEQNNLDLQVPVVTYLPTWAIGYLERQQGTEFARRITTWMLLHHTSGLDHHAGDQRFFAQVQADPHRHWTPGDILKWAADNLTPVRAPGAAFYYSDTGYTYLSLIIESLTEVGLAAAVRKLARLDMLEMPHTYWEDLEPTPPGILPRAGQYHGIQDVTPWDPSFDLYGAGGLVSSSADLNRFTRALHARQIIGGPALELMYTTESSKIYGCGLINTSFAGRQTWGHSGFWASWTFYIPSLDLAFSGTNNQGIGSSFDLERLIRSVVQQCDIPEQDPISGTLGSGSPASQPVVPDTLNSLYSFTGLSNNRNTIAASAKTTATQVIREL